MNIPTPLEVVERYRELCRIYSAVSDKFPSEIPYHLVYKVSNFTYNGQEWRHLVTEWPEEWVRKIKIYAEACKEYKQSGFYDEEASLYNLTWAIGSSRFTHGCFQVIGPDDPEQLMELAQNYFQFKNGSGSGCFAAQFINWNKATKDWVKTLTPIIFKGKRYLVGGL